MGSASRSTKTLTSHIRKAVRAFSNSSISTRFMTLVGGTGVAALVFLAIFADFIAPYPPEERFEDSILASPSSVHLFGTDNLGRDIFSRVVFGARISLSTAIYAVSFALIFGVTLGLISGYKGGIFDSFLSMTTNALYAFPSTVLAIIFVVSLGPGIVNTSVAIAVASLPLYYRVMRSLTISNKNRLFIDAAKVMGASEKRIIFVHLLPQCLSSILALSSISIAEAIIAVSGLGFLGLGIPPPTPEWGTDLGVGRRVITIGVWWPSTFPGLFVVLAVLFFNLLGEGVTNIVNPRLRRIRY